MRRYFGEQAIIALAVGYLVLLSVSITSLSYDIWGAFVVLPPLAVIGGLGVRRMFSGDLARVANVMYLALAMKFVGAAAKYFISFGAYGGSTDSQAYHEFALKAAGLVWSGKQDITSVLPSGTGTVFMQHFTAFVYTLTGTSKMGAYLIFSWMAFWGACLFVKAACLAVPRLEQRRYALWCAIGPSIVYWPSSIGKEAVMMLALGSATYGFARLLTRRGVFTPVLFTLAGLSLAAGVRPHIAALWIGGLLPALIVRLFRGRAHHGSRRGGRVIDRVVLLFVIAIAGGALVLVGKATLKFLDPSKEASASSDTKDITSILDETARRTSQAGSAFTPPSISNPIEWPFAVVRTLLRPLPIEAHGAGQLLSALEIAVFIGICLLGWRRVTNVPKLIISDPFVTFMMTTLFFGGLAYCSFANLGLLTRQKSLLLPLMFLIPCLPARPTRTQRKAIRLEQRAARAQPALAAARR